MYGAWGEGLAGLEGWEPMAPTKTVKRSKAKASKAKASSSASAWKVSEEAAVPAAVAKFSSEMLGAYQANPRLILEHANQERAFAEGGYGRRQVFELIQNGADELLGSSGQVQVVLTEEALYCANKGKPVTVDGVGAILSSYVSPKKGVEIGRFGLGFKSVLGVTTGPQFFSRSGSFLFDSDWTREEIRGVVPDAERVPALRLARVIDANRAAAEDPVLKQLMKWASTVVKLPLDEGADWLSNHLARFPGEFLVFSPQVARLILDDRTEDRKREIELRDDERGGKALIEGDRAEHWLVFGEVVRPSKAADADAGALQGRDQIPVNWAVPLEGPLARGRGRFWAFFPTEYETTLSGVVNAPWKLNEDGRSLLDGPFNRELVATAARIVVENLEALVDASDPAGVLDKLPGRGREAPNWADELITETVYELAKDEPAIPDQEGELQLPMSLKLHPEEVPLEAARIWSKAPGRPQDWCHPSIDEQADAQGAGRATVDGQGIVGLLR